MTKSPEQCEDEFPTEQKTRIKGEDGGGVVVFDGILECSQKAIDPILTIGCHKSLNVYYVFQSHFDLTTKQ